MTPRHYQGDYQTRRKRLLATITQHSICWRCGRTLDAHPAHRNGRRPYWTAGHVRDSDPSSPLALEASTCNYAAGGRLKAERAKRRNGNPTSRRWFD